MRWEFTPDEFMHIWRETNRDRYPFPLVLRSAITWRDDYARLACRLAAHLPLYADADLSAALAVAADPAISMSLTGIRRYPIRAYAAVDTTVGVTLVQRPGPDPESGANVVLEVGTPDLVPKVFAAVLGDLPAGRIPARTESVGALRRTLESPTGRSIHLHRLFRSPRSAHGHLEVRHGPHSPDPTAPDYLSWFDIPGDGRYLYRVHDGTLRLIPAAPDTLRYEIGRLLASNTQRRSPSRHCGIVSAGTHP